MKRQLRGIQLKPQICNPPLSPTEVTRFLEEFRATQDQVEKGKKLVSIRMDLPLLEKFKEECEKENFDYQKKIRFLMAKWLYEKTTLSFLCFYHFHCRHHLRWQSQ